MGAAKQDTVTRPGGFADIGGANERPIVKVPYRVAADRSAAAKEIVIALVVIICQFASSEYRKSSECGNSDPAFILRRDVDVVPFC